MKFLCAFVSIFVSVMAGLFSINSFASPAEIIIIRHGEKPASGNDLSPQGEERAEALPKFFETNPTATRFGLPVAIYAMGQKPNDPDDSIRAIETVTPLAYDLHLKIHDQYSKEQIQPMLEEVVNTPAYNGRTVVICWEHSMIPLMAQALGVQNPPQWPDSVFDRAWIFTVNGNKLAGFQNIPEDVLPGDSTF